MALALPTTFLLETRLSLDELHDLEGKIGPSLTYAISEAKLVLGKVATKQRAIFELRNRKLWTEELLKVEPVKEVYVNTQETVSYPKRRRLEATKGNETAAIDSNTESEDEPVSQMKTDDGLRKTGRGPQLQDGNITYVPTTTRPIISELSSTSKQNPANFSSNPDIGWDGTIKVVKLAWLEKCLEIGHLQPLGEYLIYEGKPIPHPIDMSGEPVITKFAKRLRTPESILIRAAADAPKDKSNQLSKGTFGHGKKSPEVHVTRPTHLLHETTSEHDDAVEFPPLPSYLHTTYSCQRPTPLYSLNDPFICQLKKIKQVRILRGDEIGVRAYSSSIAAIAAYPFSLKSSKEVLRLPCCDQKVATLYEEWQENGRCLEADELDNDEQLRILHVFWNSWGIAATTARNFYNKGWKDIDDIVENGWASLSRVQQIGIKYYDEFLLKIPRPEVEAIGKIIVTHANRIHPGYEMCIVGGYRRGKPESGDVDVILSHPNESFTAGFVEHITAALDESGYITHTLTLSTANSERGQVPVSWKGDSKAHGSGFDTLDKALVVWQDANWPSRQADLAANPKAKNPNVHRRVDILVSPWRTFGCAVMGWTSGTTFNRDLRRYCNNVKNLKFDSSGIRSREDGQWVDFESGGGTSPDYLTAEKRIFEGLGLEWREPELRCTG